MKLVFLIAAVLFFAAACKKTTPVPNISIVGRWRLAATLNDPGGGNRNWIPTYPKNPFYLQFDPDGTLRMEPYDSNNSNHYQITSDTTMIFSGGFQTLNMYYKFTPDILTIFGPCIEACGEKYVPAN